jgi:hypothetical protein
MSTPAQLPADFPASIAVESRTVENWARMIELTDAAVAIPDSEEQALEIVRWAARSGWRVRPIGAFHGWAPLLAETTDRIVLVDQTGLTGLVDFTDDPVPAATFRCGTTLAQATRELEAVDNHGAAEAPGWTFPDFPGIPDVTIGGALAIGAHGAGVRTRADQPDLFGTMSNLVLGFRAIVSVDGDYVIRDFRRDDPQAAAMLVHLGSAFLLRATLRVVPNCFLGRRVEYPDWEDLFAAPTDPPGEGSLQARVERQGRVQQLWFPFTKTPVVQSFSEEGYVDHDRVTEPLEVRLSPDIPAAFTSAFTSTLAHLPWLTPLVERAVLAEMRHLSPPDAEWHGTAGNMLLYVQHDTLRVISLAYAALVRADEVQQAVYDVAHEFDRLLHEYAKAGKDPINSCLELRVTDVDATQDLGVAGAVPALLSPVRPLPGSQAERAIWFDLVTTPGMPGSVDFYREFEAWLWQRFAEPGSLRAEWSKAWAFGPEGAWSDERTLDRILRSYDPDGTLDTARKAREQWRVFDASGVYGSPLIDRLFGGD